MALRRRTAQLDTNFDGLTDAVTNLVGALVLIILLLLAVTSKKVSDTPPAPADAQTNIDLHSAEELLNQVTQLRAGIEGLGQDLKMSREKFDEFRIELAKLTGDIQRSNRAP